jgi:glutamate-1-semialdehyde 2,1-aminomutase
MPVGAFGGREEIMRMLAPEGPVYQAGTLSGNPVAMAAGIATLKRLKDKKIYQELEEKGDSIEKGLQTIAAKHPNLCFQRVGSMFCLYFQPGPVCSFEDAKRSDTKAFSQFFHCMLDRGIYLPPAQFEACFISAAHTKDDLQGFLAAAEASLQCLYG